MAERRGQLIAFRNDRLGARLLTLVNAMRIASDHGLEFAVHWPQAVDVTAVFNDATELFDARFVSDHFISREDWLARRASILRIGDMMRAGVRRLCEEVGKGHDVAVDQAFGINVLKDEEDAVVRQSFIRTLRQIPFADALKPAIAAVGQALDGATAYHIRRGDLTDGLNAKNKPWPHKMVPNEFYELHMERALGDRAGTAILFSDDAPTLAHYCQMFPGLRTIRDIVDIDQLTEAQRDFIELYAMSRCTKIIAPERSAFSSTAVDLGDAEKCTVTEDMTDEMSSAAYERLLARLRDRPESFSGEGDIGQSLAHVGPWLAAQERWDEAAQLYAGHVAAGVNIAFVYPDAMRYLHRAGDIEGVLEVARHMQAGYVYHVRYYVDAEIQHGYGRIRAGNRTEGIRHIVNGFWHGPTGGASRALIPAMVQSGLLTAQNFLPVSPLQMNLHRRKGLRKQLAQDYPEIFNLPDADLPNAIASIETAIWDWAPLLRGTSTAAAARNGLVAYVRQMVERSPGGGDDDGEKESLIAILDAYEGDVSGAVKKLTVLAAENPDHMMTWQRLSHAHMIGRYFHDAADAAEQAAALGQDVPAMQAWSGMMQMRTRGYARGVELVTRADAAQTGFPAIPALLAQALDATGEPAKALAALDRAIVLAPLEGEYALQRARLLEALDRAPEAVETLERMVELYRAPGKMFRHLIGLLTRMGETKRSDEMFEICRERFPEHPVTLRLIEERAA